MFKNRKVVRGIILAVLLLCTAYLVYSLLANPLGEHDIILALAVTAGFHHLIWAQKKQDKTLKIIISAQKKKQKKKLII